MPGIRPADAEYIMDKLFYLPNEAAVHEFGAWDMNMWKVLGYRFQNLLITDSFAWKTRAGCQNMRNPDVWMEEIRTGKYTVVKHDIQHPLPDEFGKFDAVVSVSVLEHVVDDALALSHIYNSLKPGGEIVLTTEVNLYVGMNYRDDIAFRVYTPEELWSKLERAGFEVEKKIEPFNDETFDTKMKEAMANPGVLIHPYHHFCSAGITARKPE